MGSTRCGSRSTRTSRSAGARRGAGSSGAPPLPDEYGRTHDQFVALAAAAAVTTTLRLGTGITLVAQRDPIWLAKEVASLDVISGGRLLFGIGYGWNHEEMESHGVDIGHRRAVVREKVLACKALWSQDVAEFHGKYVDFEPSWSWPKPVQSPHPPIVIGASPTDLHFRHIIEYGDVWMPIQGRWPIDEAWLKLQQAAEAAGRDPATSEPRHLRSQARQGQPGDSCATSAPPWRR